MCAFFSNLSIGDILQVLATIAIGIIAARISYRANQAMLKANDDADFRFLLQIIKQRVDSCNAEWNGPQSPGYNTAFVDALYEKWSPLVTVVHQSLDIIDYLAKDRRKEAREIFWMLIDVQIKDLFERKYNPNELINKNDPYIPIFKKQILRIKSTLPT